MPIKFSGFPQKASTDLGRFVDYKSLLRLREISKAVKGFVDVSVHRTWVRLIKIEREIVTSDITLSFELCVDEEYFLWENCFTKAIKTIGDVKSICFDYGYHVLSFPWMDLIKKCNLHTFDYFSRTLAKDDIDFLFQFSKVSRTMRIYVDNYTYNNVNIVLTVQEILRGVCETLFLIVRNRGDFIISNRDIESLLKVHFPWMDLIKKCNLHTFDYFSRTLAKDDIDFLFQFSKVSRTMRIYVDNYTYNNVNIVLTVQEILRGVCETLFLIVRNRGDFIISNRDIESLLKVQ
ncbi:hypothetical protein PRIPAC_75929 [Pristionchus pacificus]|uniref:F-box domain-containing protein n=1 Tax=Pristionchus pacificus TaxID=54126 RepID=A0A2A6C1A0_PRIPA|nr:hypothetical protein PRIPAC_75929 [Pristionchus pacificus]|eukprot:PDM71888.1 F-box domain-containing protein [Pristionchus pacificus]